MIPSIYITYDMVFDDEPLPLFEYLKEFNRDFLIQFALRLIYCSNDIKNFDSYKKLFFSSSNKEFVNHIDDKLYQKCVLDSNCIIPHSYSILSESTGLELLRHTFAVEEFENVLSNTILEQYLFKILLIINQNISSWIIPKDIDDKGDYTSLFYAKSIFCSFFNGYENLNLEPEFLLFMQIIKGYNFFEYCESSNLQPILSKFLKNHGKDSWQSYLCDVIRLILYPLKRKDCNYPIITLNDKLDGYDFLHSNSFNVNDVIPIDKNKDYTFFKAYPLIELDNKRFIPINSTFCINNLYKSIYFKFKEINDSLVGSNIYIKDLRSLLTTEFSENFLFNKYVLNTLCNQRGVKLSDRDCKEISNKNRRPDFYHRDGNNIFIFENKDIKIPDYVISNKKWIDFENVLNKKLISDAGVSQLVYNISRIDKKNFPWDSNIPNNPRIYPIIVIEDSSICVHGLNYILNEAFQQQLIDKNVKIKTHPLVVIELDTFIAFAEDFRRGKIKLKNILDDYYSYLYRRRKNIEPEDFLYETYHKYFSFYTFLSDNILHKRFDNTDFDRICNALKIYLK